MHHAIKAYSGLEVVVLCALSFGTNGRKLTNSCFGLLTLTEGAHGTHWMS